MTDEVDTAREAVPGLFETASDQDAVARAAAAAAPIVAERADLAMVSTLEPALRGPMFGLLSSLADNKYLLGRRYAEWCTGAPMLESAVAAAAMAQDELGHARSFYPLLRGFPQGRGLTQMEEQGWQQRSTSAMTCLNRHFATWFDFLAANLLIDGALTTLLAAAVDSPYEPLRQRARKIQQEEQAHAIHGVGWFHRLQPHPADLAAALGRVWDDAFTYFGQPDDPTIAPLAAVGLLAADPDTLRRNLTTRLAPLLTHTDTANPLLARPLPWSRWDAATRRLAPSTESS